MCCCVILQIFSAPGSLGTEVNLMQKIGRLAELANIGVAMICRNSARIHDNPLRCSWGRPCGTSAGGYGEVVLVATPGAQRASRGEDLGRAPMTICSDGDASRSGSWYGISCDPTPTR